MGNVTSKWSVIILDFVHYNTLQCIIMLTPDFRRFRDDIDQQKDLLAPMNKSTLTRKTYM